MINIFKYFGVIAILLAFFPIQLNAQETPPHFTSGVVACDTSSGGILGSDFGCVILHLVDLLNILNPILFSLSFIVFFWGLTKFVLNSDSKDEIEKGKNYMIWAVIALFILISFRVIITFISTDLGLGDSSGIPYIPRG